jgi:hypothetical protein
MFSLSNLHMKHEPITHKPAAFEYGSSSKILKSELISKPLEGLEEGARSGRIPYLDGEDEMGWAISKETLGEGEERHMKGSVFASFVFHHGSAAMRRKSAT